jgi:hypothetical protein
MAQAEGVYRVALKLPQFWLEDVDLWLEQVDGAFVVSQITEERTKYAYVIKELPPAVICQVRDL